MKKIFSIFAALTLSVGLWAQTAGTTILVHNLTGWDNLLLYMWGDGGNDLGGAWPGFAAQREDEGNPIFLVAEGEYDGKSENLIFNNGNGLQLADYPITLGDSYELWVTLDGVFDEEPAPAPVEGDQFVDATSGLKFQVTAVGEANTVKVIKNDYTGTSYTIPATVKYNDVDFAVTKIEGSTFKGCSSLQSVTIPASVTTIGASAFYGCSSLQSVTIPASVTTIGTFAFNECSSLLSVTLSEGLLTIVDGAFFGCSSLQSITIPASVTTIGSSAFAAERTSLTSVTFLGNACQNAIGESAFFNVGIPNPATLVLPADWTGIKPDEDGRWYDGFFKLTAPAPVEGDQFVDATSGLMFEVTAVGEANTVKVIANSYTGTSYTIPATVKCNDVDFAVTEIESVAFAGCATLQSITLSEGLTKIGYNAFGECSALVSINIPASVTEIESYAFADCSGLTSVTFLGNACQNAINEDAFLNVGKEAPALLTLPNSWTGTLPDEDGNWYGGKFELSEEPSGWVNVNVNADVNKYLYNGQMIIRKGDKLYNAVGAEL